MSATENYLKIKAALPQGVRLVAVSKNQPVRSLLELYQAGHRVFGENKAQELIAKYPEMPQDVEWHFIGHLQTNKVRSVIRMAGVIESVDSLRLLREIDREAAAAGKVAECYLQFHIATEETKFGLSREEAIQLLDDPSFKEMNNVRITGVMGMATFTDDESRIRREYQRLREYFTSLKAWDHPPKVDFKEISAGMTDDYLIAVAEGSTNVRIGTAIFGERRT